MDVRVKVIYYVTDSGRRPVEEFVDDLNIRSRRKFVDAAEVTFRNIKGAHHERIYI